MPRLTRPDGAEISWEERAEGPTVVFSPVWLNWAAVFEDLLADLAADHRIVTWDPRGTGGSSRMGPYDIGTDVGDLEAVIEACGADATLVELLAPRSILLGAARPDLVRSVVITGTAPPLGSKELAGVEGFAGSTQVIDGLTQLLESDYRAALRAVLSGTNPEMSEDELRARTEETAAMIDHAAAAGRLRATRDQLTLGQQAAALGERLSVVCFETPWYTPAMVARAREMLPQADIVQAEDGPISRPDFTAAAVRRFTAATRT